MRMKRRATLSLSLLAGTSIIYFLIMSLVYEYRGFYFIGMFTGLLLPFIVAGLTGVAKTTTV